MSSLTAHTVLDIANSMVINGVGKAPRFSNIVLNICVCVCVQLAKDGNGLQALSLTSYVLHF